MTFDMTLSLGTLITVIGLVIAFVNHINKMGAHVKALSDRMDDRDEIRRTEINKNALAHDALQQQINIYANGFANYKLEASEKFASVGHLRDVEERLVKSVDRVVDEVKGLRSDISEVMRAATGAPRRPGRSAD